MLQFCFAMDDSTAQQKSGALSVWQREIAMLRIAESLTCRIVFADINIATMTSLVFGTATFKAALPSMDFLARVRDSALWVALHGADGEEDEAVVDEELKAHMTYVQQQCDDLRRQVVRLNASKELLATRLEPGRIKLVVAGADIGRRQAYDAAQVGFGIVLQD